MPAKHRVAANGSRSHHVQAVPVVRESFLLILNFIAFADEGGPVIVLGNLNIQKDFPERTYNKLLGTTLHKRAHCLERLSLFMPRP